MVPSKQRAVLDKENAHTLMQKFPKACLGTVPTHPKNRAHVVLRNCLNVTLRETVCFCGLGNMQQSANILIALYTLLATVPFSAT